MSFGGGDKECNSNEYIIYNCSTVTHFRASSQVSTETVKTHIYFKKMCVWMCMCMRACTGFILKKKTLVISWNFVKLTGVPNAVAFY